MIDWKEIRDIFVTHRHMDHILGVMWLIRMIAQAMKQDEYEGKARIYGHKKVLCILDDMSHMLLAKREAEFVGGRIQLVPVSDGDVFDIIGHKTTFFNIHSTKTKQHGFTMYLNKKDKLACCGDEPYNDTERMYVQGCKWLLHEAFCLTADEGRYAPHEKHHSTVEEACATAEKLHVENLVLYHTEDSDVASRKERYTAEGGKYFSGNLYVPDDLDMIEYFKSLQIPILLVATKIDKIPKTKRVKALKNISQKLQLPLKNIYGISSTEKIGFDEVYQAIIHQIQ